MKTIEERANERFPINYKTDTCEFTFNQSGRQYGYIEGATKQREIDIERAWKYFDDYFEEEDKREAKVLFTKYMKGE